MFKKEYLFYHHVYSVLGDPSLPVFLEKPKILSSDLDLGEDGLIDEPLNHSYIMTYLYDENGYPIQDVVGALFKDDQPFEYLVDAEFDRYSIYRGMTDSNGLLIIDFELDEEAELTLYLNKPQFLQKKRISKNRMINFI